MKLRVLAALTAAISMATPIASATDVAPHHPSAVLNTDQFALQSALTGEDAGVAAFYERRGYSGIWFAHPGKIELLLDTVAQADRHALPVAGYDLAGARARVATASDPASRAAAELALTRLYLSFARDLSSGLLDPGSVDSEIGHRPQLRAAEDLLRVAYVSPDIAASLEALAPSTQTYRQLLRERRVLEDVVSAGGWGAMVPEGQVLRPGRNYRAVPVLRARLTAMGYPDLGDSRVYDEELLVAVKLFQSRHGLNADGVAGPATLSAINVSAQERLGQVLANLERERWMNFDRGSRHIYVNLAAYEMAVIDDGQETFRSRVVIGKRKDDFRTPEFSHRMTHLVVNPYWHVPKSIAQREYLPMLKQDPQVLSRLGLQLYGRRGPITIPENADFSGYSEGNFPFNIKQPPGRRNALGRVKFMFPNRHNIYLHDTPAKKLFYKDWRAQSHGCVRVQRPFDLAYHLLEPQFENPEATFHNYLRRGTEKFVYLDAPVDVHLSYHTAFVDPTGAVQYRGDVYGRDRRIQAALKAAGVAMTPLEG